MKREGFLVLLLTLGLAACDGAPEPGRRPAAAPTASAPAATPGSAPPAGAPAEPAAPTAPAHVQARPATHSSAAAAPSALRPLVRPLDLSLPRDTSKEFFLRDDDEAPLREPRRLLPPLFDKHKAQPSGIGVSGRLLTNPQPQTGKSYWNGIDGAEVQLQFRH